MTQTLPAQEETRETAGRPMEVLHIAGTNGKGSVASYAANILGMHHKTGLYSSPHLMDPTERFSMNGVPIGKVALAKYVNRSQQQRQGLPFAHWTHAAKDWLEEEEAEYAVVETGLGGRLDPTTIFDSHVQVITKVDYDHMNMLGNSIGEIAAEKSGIIRPGSTVLSARQMPDAAEAIEAAAAERDAKVVVYDPSGVTDYESSLDGQTFTFRQDGLELHDVHISALSPGQVENACLASLAAYYMGIPVEDIHQGLEATRLKGRAQYIPPDILLDGAHNPAAMLELRRVLARNFSGRGVVALFGVMKDKDIAGMAKSINAFANEIYCTTLDTPRGLRLPQYKRYFNSSELIEDPMEAAREAYRRAQQNGDLLVVCGSFYLIRPALEALGQTL